MRDAVRGKGETSKPSLASKRARQPAIQPFIPVGAEGGRGMGRGGGAMERDLIECGCRMRGWAARAYSGSTLAVIARVSGALYTLQDLLEVQAKCNP
jgi:hypothetical protein